jgi:biopolymer transport protein ExbB/TolQ
MSTKFYASRRIILFAIVEAAGWPIWFLIFASIIAVGLIVDRLLFLRSNKIAPPALLNEVYKELKQRGVSDGMLSKLHDNSPLGRIFAAGLKNIKSTQEVMKESIEEAGRATEHELSRFLTTLGTIASISPLLGLFGTVVGMIEIFGSRHFNRFVQHRVRPDCRDPQHDLLSPFPRQSGQLVGRDGTASHQAGRDRARSTQRLKAVL